MLWQTFEIQPFFIARTFIRYYICIEISLFYTIKSSVKNRLQKWFVYIWPFFEEGTCSYGLQWCRGGDGSGISNLISMRKTDENTSFTKENLLATRNSRTATYSDSAFSSQAPIIWNALLLELIKRKFLFYKFKNLLKPNILKRRISNSSPLFNVNWSVYYVYLVFINYCYILFCICLIIYCKCLWKHP